MTARAVAAGALGVLLAGCGSGSGADIGRISALENSFGPDFTVTQVPPAGIDPKILAGQKLPDGVRFEPAGCAKFADGALVPPGTQGNMAAVSAEGQGNRFIIIAVQTSQAVPVLEPGSDCRKVTFAGGPARGSVEVVEAPTIEGATTLGVHRIVQTMLDGKPRTGEVYSYSAHFGDYQVIVSANPLVLPDKPVVPVNTQRARDLLIAGVNAVRR